MGDTSLTMAGTKESEAGIPKFYHLFFVIGIKKFHHYNINFFVFMHFSEILIIKTYSYGGHIIKATTGGL